MLNVGSCRAQNTEHPRVRTRFVRVDAAVCVPAAKRAMWFGVRVTRSHRPTRVCDKGSVDRIEFRSLERDLPWSGHQDLREAAVEIVANGETLDSIWSRAGGPETLPLSVEDLLS